MTLSPGQILNNRYRIVKLLGQGGFGAVYRAWDLQMEGTCAVKENLETSPTSQKQFEREAKLLYKLRHPSLPRVFDHFMVPNQGQYLVMDYIEGEDLGSMIQRTGGPLPETQVIDWIGQVCDALTYLHAQNPPIIHRDIKPANIRITPFGQAMLVDFGIAKLYDPTSKTTTGARAVTPGYSPPEQFGLGSTDAQSDVYALGATIYHLLTGHAPPAAMDVMAGSSAPPILIHLLNPVISPQVSLAVEKAMKPNRSERLGNAAELKIALTMFKSGVPMQSTVPPLASPTVQVSPGQPAYTPTGMEAVTQVESTPSSVFRNVSPRVLRIGMFILIVLLLGGILAIGLTLGRNFIHQEATRTSVLTPLAITTLEGEVTQKPGFSITPLAGSPTPALSGSPLPPLSITQEPALPSTPLALPEEAIDLENAIRVSQLARWGRGTLEKAVWSPDGNLLAAASATGVYFYNPNSLAELNHIATSSTVKNLVFSPDGKILVTGLYDASVMLWKVSDGSLLFPLKNSFFFDGMAFSPDGEILATGSLDSAIRLWRVSNGNLIGSLKDEQDVVTSLAFTPDGRILAAGYHGGLIKFWQVSDSSLIRNVEGHEYPVWSLSFSPEGMYLASCSGDTTLRLWNSSDGTLIDVFGDSNRSPVSLAFSPDGLTLASGMSDGRITLWKIPDMTPEKSFSGHRGNVSSVAFSPDGSRLVSASIDKTLRVWQVIDGKELASLSDFSSSQESLALSPDNLLLASGAMDNLGRIWRVSDGSLIHFLEGHAHSVSSMGFMPDGQLLVTGSDDTTVRLWQVSDGTLSNVLKMQTGANCLAISSNGNTIATGSWDKTVRLSTLSIGGDEVLQTKELEGHTDFIQDVAFSPNGEFLASASWDNTAILWRVSDGALLHTLKGHSSYVYAVVFSPDGETLATGAYDGSVNKWRVSDGSLLKSLPNPGRVVTSLAISPRGTILAIGYLNGEIHLWRYSDGSILHTLAGHASQVTRLVFSSDGLFLASSSRDGTIRIWGIPPL